MIGDSTQQKIFGDHSNIHPLVSKKQFLKDTSKVTSTKWDFGSFKNCFLVTKEYVLERSPKIFVGCYHLSCVLASFLGIISIRRNQMGSQTTFQTDFIISNVRRWQFFDFDTPLKVKSTEWDFGSLKNCFLVTKGCMLEWSPKIFCWVLPPIMCACKLP